MKCVQAAEIGRVEDYRIIETSVPAPGAEEVLIQISACAMGYFDALVALGKYQVKPELPFVPGQEFAGTIVEVGSSVEGLAKGDRVLAHSFGGGLAQYIRISAAEVSRIPDNMSFKQAAGFKINYMTALHALRDRANLQAGERLVVFGAAGGVGSAAVQVGRAMGAEVIAVASSESKRSFAAEIGAQMTLDTEEAGWRDRLKSLCAGTGPDVILDPVSGPLFEPAFRSLAWRGRHLVIGYAAGSIPKLPINLALLKGASLVGVDARQFMIFESRRAQEHLEQLYAWIADGTLVPPVGREFALEDFAEAMEFALSGQGMAKTIINLP